MHYAQIYGSPICTLTMKTEIRSRNPVSIWYAGTKARSNSVLESNFFLGGGGGGGGGGG